MAIWQIICVPNKISHNTTNAIQLEPRWMSESKSHWAKWVTNWVINVGKLKYTTDIRITTSDIKKKPRDLQKSHLNKLLTHSHYQLICKLFWCLIHQLSYKMSLMWLTKKYLSTKISPESNVYLFRDEILFHLLLFCCLWVGWRLARHLENSCCFTSHINAHIYIHAVVTWPSHQEVMRSTALSRPSI